MAILELLGVTRGVVAITKADLVDDDWLELVEDDVRGATAALFPDAPIDRDVGDDGQGLAELRAALASSLGARERDTRQDERSVPPARSTARSRSRAQERSSPGPCGPDA